MRYQKPGRILRGYGHFYRPQTYGEENDKQVSTLPHLVTNRSPTDGGMVTPSLQVVPVFLHILLIQLVLGTVRDWPVSWLEPILMQGCLTLYLRFWGFVPHTAAAGANAQLRSLMNITWKGSYLDRLNELRWPLGEVF